MQEKAKPFVRYDTPEKLISFFVPMFVGKTKERLYVAYLDNAGKMLHCSMVAEGFSDLLQIPMQEIIHNAYTYSSKNIVIAHNHPTGLSNPSGNDLLATNNLIKVLKELEMSLIDHIIVGKRSDAISMHSLGYFNDPRDLIWKDGGLDRVD